MPSLLEIRGLTRRFGGLTAVNAVDLHVAEGELLSVIGPNGAGKTTLFNLVTGLDRPDAGQVLFDGQDITGLPAQQLAQRGLARTFQHGRVFANLSLRSSAKGLHRASTIRRTASRMRTAVASRSHVRWHSSRACCCSTNPRPA